MISDQFGLLDTVDELNIPVICFINIEMSIPEKIHQAQAAAMKAKKSLSKPKTPKAVSVSAIPSFLF